MTGPAPTLKAPAAGLRRPGSGGRLAAAAQPRRSCGEDGRRPSAMYPQGVHDAHGCHGVRHRTQRDGGATAGRGLVRPAGRHRGRPRAPKAAGGPNHRAVHGGAATAVRGKVPGRDRPPAAAGPLDRTTLRPRPESRRTQALPAQALARGLPRHPAAAPRTAHTRLHRRHPVRPPQLPPLQKAAQPQAEEPAHARSRAEAGTETPARRPLDHDQPRTPRRDRRGRAQRDPGRLPTPRRHRTPCPRLRGHDARPARQRPARMDGPRPHRRPARPALPGQRHETGLGRRHRRPVYALELWPGQGTRDQSQAPQAHGLRPRLRT